MTYAIVEVMKTLQGEGINVGRSAIFVRFAGCNLWSGQDVTRSADARRHGATCPLFCDTDFRMRDRLGLDELLDHVRNLLPADIVVFTGGEPALQLDPALVSACTRLGLETCIETNGTVAIDPVVADMLSHICVSPKLPDEKILVRSGTELKVVVPRYNPREYAALAGGFKYRFVSPEAATSQVGRSLVVRSAEKLAATWCMENPPWRLSLQTHKHLEIP